MKRILVALLLASAATAGHALDLILRGGTVFDGTGAPGVVADVGIEGDRIKNVGTLAAGPATRVVDVSGLAVTPGFINMLSWATESLLIDGRSQGDIRQGVTLEVFGEGESMGPLTPAMRANMLARQTEARFDIPWTTLGEYLDHLVTRGVSTNVASFVGATTVRVHELDHADRAPDAAELTRMQDLVREAMREGAMGVGSALIYAPGFYADTNELVSLARTAAESGGMYISHMRSEGNRVLESVDELVHIARVTGAPAQIHHLKLSGAHNWPKFDALVARVQAARTSGLQVSANMYTYTAGSTGLDAAMPPWSQEGGFAAWSARLQAPQTRARIRAAMLAPTDDWENLLFAAGAEGTLLAGFRNPALRHYIGRTLAEVAREREVDPVDAAMDLVVEDGSRVQVIYFLMSETNVARKIQLPWMTFGSDAASMTAGGVFLRQGTHPRAYGNFARLLGRYVREQNVISLADAVHRLSGLPATHLKLQHRGRIEPGFFADVVVFDPAAVTDHATFEQPHQYSTGVRHVLVNGTFVLEDETHTGALPGRVVRGPGWCGWR